MISEEYGGGGNFRHTVGSPRGGQNDKERESRFMSWAPIDYGKEQPVNCWGVVGLFGGGSTTASGFGQG